MTIAPAQSAVGGRNKRGDGPRSNAAPKPCMSVHQLAAVHDANHLHHVGGACIDGLRCRS